MSWFEGLNTVDDPSLAGKGRGVDCVNAFLIFFKIFSLADDDDEACITPALLDDW
jgi:hypothetical protein